MKRFVLVAMAAVAACTSERPVENAPGSGRVVLATFDGEVDALAGTVVTRIAPSAAGQALGSVVKAPLDLDVTVASTGTFINSGLLADKCPPPSSFSGNTWGAMVTIANLRSTYSISGVYAEIQTFPSTGSESCSNDPGPSDLSNQYGLWSYGPIGPGATSPGKKWIFQYNAAASARFTFRGRVVGVRMYAADVGATPLNQEYPSGTGVYGTALADTGSGLAMARVAGSNYFIDLVGYDGVRTNTVPVPAGVLSIAASATRIWYSTQAEDSGSLRCFVGSMALDGSSEAHAPMSNEYCPLQTIVPDPGDAKAWFLSGGFNEIRSYTPPTTVGPETGPVVYPPTSMALGPDGRLYVSTDTSQDVRDQIRVYSIATDPVTEETPITIPAGLGCSWPLYMANEPDGKKLWFGANDPADGNSICNVSRLGGDVTKFASVLKPGVLAFGEGVLWTTSGMASGNGRQLQRVDATGVGLGIPTYPDGTSYPGGVATSTGAVWVTDLNGLWRVVP